MRLQARMRSSWIRAQAVVSLFLLLLAAVCGLASFTDVLHPSSPLVDVQAALIEVFHRQAGGGNDEVQLMLYITSDFRAVFSWTTKQVFVTVAAEYHNPNKTSSQITLWDTLYENKEVATFQRWTRNKYDFVDKGNNLRGLAGNLTVSWGIQPRTGMIVTDNKVISGFKLPVGYLQ